MSLDLLEPVATTAPDIAPSPSGSCIDADRSESSALDFLALETLALNLDASLRVHSRAHFFNWTQGILQSLVKHEVLICATRNAQPLLFRVDSFSTSIANPLAFGDMLVRDSALSTNLIKAWEARDFKPVTCSARDGLFAGGPLAREMETIKATHVIAHGTHDLNGQVTSLFVFACRPETVLPRQEYLVELLVPHLHTAWIRTRLSQPQESLGSKRTDGSSPLTVRELEILRWVCLGKSNFEIGAILSISQLTVKNHVQKILRKLNVVNRTQAVGKAVELRLLDR